MEKKRSKSGLSGSHGNIPGKKEANPAVKKLTKGVKSSPRSSSSQPGLESQPFFIVGVGASAGGLEAFTELLRHLPSDTGLALVLVQHLDPKHESMLTLLLSKTTPMPVHEVRNGESVEPNHVYVIPPNTDMAISNGALSLMPRGEIYGRHMAVDHFFFSLAEDQGSHAIGIILSGTASDGAMGLKAIKAEGGITFAQDEESAKYGGMPHSAVLAGAVDFILPPEGIAKKLIEISRNAFALPGAAMTPAGKSEEMEPGGFPTEGGSFQEILRLLLSTTGVDFSCYKQATIERRVVRRLVLRKMENLAGYANYLKNNPAELETLYQDILIHVTAFFREPETFEALKTTVFPIILKRRSPETPIRIWVPGCSTGEEVYSFAIALMEFLGEKSQNIPIRIFATDISEPALEKARSGKYLENIISAVSAERLQRFFIKVESGYQVSKPVREMCVFARQDLTKDPPFSSMDLISCRNVLIYLTPLMQKRLMGTFHFALKPAGYLFLGKTEGIGGFSEFFELVDKKQKIYSRKTTAAHPAFGFAYSNYEIKKTNLSRGIERDAFDLEAEANRIVLSKYAPAGVIINDHLDILHFRDHTGPYIEPSPGEASWNLLRMVREGLKLELRTAIHEARKKGDAVRKEGLQIRHDGQFREVNIEVLPIKSPPGERYFLILFEEVQAPVPVDSTGNLGAKEISPAQEKTKIGRKPEKEDRTVLLEQELTATKKYLQSIIEEQEATNEELRAANEEILSANEEFQSINEELETGRQELQSTNEELITLNEELHNRNTEYAQLNSDLINLFGSINLPVIMLGEDLRIRRFTPMAERVLNLIPTDIGRLISDVKLSVHVPQLELLIVEVINTVTVKKMEVKDRADRWHSLEIRPYRTMDNKIEGAVLVFSDIDALKKSLEQVVESRDYAEGIVDTVREPLVILHKDLRVKTANRSFYQIFQFKPEETENHFLYEIGNRQWDIPELRDLLETILPKKNRFQDFEVEHDFSGIGHRVMLLNRRQIEQPGSGSQLILLAIEDITERKALEVRIRDFNKQLLSAQEQERAYIAAEIHDSLGQSLSSIKIRMDRLVQEMHKSADKPVAGAFETIRQMIEQNIIEARRLQQGLRPSLLEDLGILVTIEWFCREFQTTHSGIRIEKQIDLKEDEVPPSLKIVIYRILQESLHNVAKHSQADLVHLALKTNDGKLEISIQDNGCGFDVNKVLYQEMPRRGLGISSMEERAKLSGGFFKIESMKGQGTIIQAWWPLEQ